MQLGIYDPGPGFDKAKVKSTDVARPIAECPPIGIEQPGSDHDLIDDVTGEAGTIEQERPFILGRCLHRLPSDRYGTAQLLDLCRGSGEKIAFVGFAVQFLDNVRHLRSDRSLTVGGDYTEFVTSEWV